MHGCVERELKELQYHSAKQKSLNFHVQECPAPCSGLTWPPFKSWVSFRPDILLRDLSCFWALSEDWLGISVCSISILAQPGAVCATWVRGDKGRIWFIKLCFYFRCGCIESFGIQLKHGIFFFSYNATFAPSNILNNQNYGSHCQLWCFVFFLKLKNLWETWGL